MWTSVGVVTYTPTAMVSKLCFSAPPFGDKVTDCLFSVWADYLVLNFCLLGVGGTCAADFFAFNWWSCHKPVHSNGLFIVSIFKWPSWLITVLFWILSSVKSILLSPCHCLISPQQLKLCLNTNKVFWGTLHVLRTPSAHCHVWHCCSLTVKTHL